MYSGMHFCQKHRWRYYQRDGCPDCNKESLKCSECFSTFKDGPKPGEKCACGGIYK